MLKNGVFNQMFCWNTATEFTEEPHNTFLHQVSCITTSSYSVQRPLPHLKYGNTLQKRVERHNHTLFHHLYWIFWNGYFVGTLDINMCELELIWSHNCNQSILFFTPGHQWLIICIKRYNFSHLFHLQCTNTMTCRNRKLITFFSTVLTNSAGISRHVCILQMDQRLSGIRTKWYYYYVLSHLAVYIHLAQYLAVPKGEAGMLTASRQHVFCSANHPQTFVLLWE